MRLKQIEDDAMIMFRRLREHCEGTARPLVHGHVSAR